MKINLGHDCGSFAQPSQGPAKLSSLMQASVGGGPSILGSEFLQPLKPGGGQDFRDEPAQNRLAEAGTRGLQAQPLLGYHLAHAPEVLCPYRVLKSRRSLSFWAHSSLPSKTTRMFKAMLTSVLFSIQAMSELLLLISVLQRWSCSPGLLESNSPVPSIPTDRTSRAECGAKKNPSDLGI